jgi:hypothetical protein
VTIAKGLPAKVMNTADGGVDDAADQWVVENFKEMSPEVAKADKDFSKVPSLVLLHLNALLRLRYAAVTMAASHTASRVLFEPSQLPHTLT